MYLLCYDIANGRRLRLVAKIMESYGVRVQKSFFQADVRKERLEELVRKVLSVLNRRQDSFAVYPICESCVRTAESDGTAQLLTLDSYEIL